MMEEEFGMREPPQAGTRFGGSSEWPLSPLIPWLKFSFHVCLALGLPSMLRILPPKRKKTLTQIPEPHRNASYLKGSWETVWGCDVNDVDFVESPPEDLDPLDSAPGQDSGLDEIIATPTNGAPWSTDGEITPMFSSNFPSTPNPDALRCEGHPDAESLRTSASRHGSAEFHAP